MSHVCPECGLRYDDLRTGLAYKDIYDQFWRADDDPTSWHPKRRHTILGRWHEIKQALWEEHLERCGVPF